MDEDLAVNASLGLAIPGKVRALYVDGGGIGLGVGAARFASEKYRRLPGRHATSLPPSVRLPGLSLSMLIGIPG